MHYKAQTPLSAKAPLKSGWIARRRPTRTTQMPNAGLIAQALGLTRATFAGRVGKTIMTLMVAAFVVIGGTAYVQIRLNIWNKPFYDALSRRDLHDFWCSWACFSCLRPG